MTELLLARGTKKRLLTLVKAIEAWKAAALCWRQLRASGVQKNAVEYDLLALPVVVLYGRPFTACGGLSPLAGYCDFSTAPDPSAFAHNHNLMMEARHKAIAHLDIPGTQRIIDGRTDFARTDFLAVRREKDRSLSFETKNLMPDLLNGLGVPTLLAHQIARLGNELGDETERQIGEHLPVGASVRLVDRESRRSGEE